jgi:hypothetical protein
MRVSQLDDRGDNRFGLVRHQYAGLFKGRQQARPAVSLDCFADHAQRSACLFQVFTGRFSGFLKVRDALVRCHGGIIQPRAHR